MQVATCFSSRHANVTSDTRKALVTETAGAGDIGKRNAGACQSYEVICIYLHFEIFPGSSHALLAREFRLAQGPTVTGDMRMAPVMVTQFRHTE